MELFFLFGLVWLLFAAWVSALAAEKGYGAAGWFVLGLLFGPIALIIAAALPAMRR